MPFELGKSLSQCRKAVILLPEGFQENLVAFPVVQSMIEDLPGCDFLVLAEQDLTGFISALFGPGRVLGLRSAEFFWGEGHFQEVQRGITAFRPEIFINLRESSPPLLHFLMRASLATLRIHPAKDARWPFANLVLKSAEPPNILRRVLMVPHLWDFADRPVSVQWSRLLASPENLKEAGSVLASKGLNPELTRIFLWQNHSLSRQRELLQAALAERSTQGAAKSLILVNGAGSLHPTPAPPQEMTQGVPRLEVESTGLLLGLFARTALSIGLNGPLLHLAGLADTDVVGHFSEEDAPWDTSFLNPRMRVAYPARAPGTVEGESVQGTPRPDL